MEFKAENYLNRQDLESFIKNKVGTDSNVNRNLEHKIIGTRAKLKEFFLDDICEIWGVKVEITDTPIAQILQQKLEASKKVEKPIKLGKKGKKKKK